MVIQLLSRVRFFLTPWTAAHQASLSFTISKSVLTLTSIESVMPSNHLVLCCPLLLLPSIFPSRVFSNETAPYPSLLHLTFLIDLWVQTLGNEGSALEKMGWKGRWEWGLQDLPTLHCRGRHQELGFPFCSLGFISWGSEFDCEESWVPENWCFWTVALEKTLQSPLDYKEIQPVLSKGDQS